MSDKQFEEISKILGAYLIEEDRPNMPKFSYSHYRKCIDRDSEISKWINNNRGGKKTRKQRMIFIYICKVREDFIYMHNQPQYFAPINQLLYQGFLDFKTIYDQDGEEDE